MLVGFSLLIVILLLYWLSLSNIKWLRKRVQPSTNSNLVEENKLISTRCCNVFHLLLNGNIQDKLIRGRFDPHVDVMLMREKRSVYESRKMVESKTKNH